ncbi:MAG: HAMP domain-containing sensor histidine kinase [bacterium]
MKITPVKRIGLLLIIIVLVPVILFSFYQISLQTDNEKTIEKAYTEQIETVLFSINQFNEDLVSNWKIQIESSLINPQLSLTKKSLLGFIETNPAINAIIISDTLFNNQTYYSINNYRHNLSLFHTYKDIFTRLQFYRQKSYNKTEPLAYNSSSTLLLCILGYGTENYFCGIIIDNNKFIKDNLAAKILRTIENKFSITVVNTKTKKQIFTFGQFNSKAPSQNYQNFWLLPNHIFGIALKGDTLKDIANRQAKFNLFALISMLIVIFTGVYYIFKNTRKEIELAQIKADFVSNVSHELRTPLALISMYAETLELDRINDEVKKKDYIKTISKETARLSHIVNSILNFSKMEAGKRVFNLSKNDLTAIVFEVVETYLHQINQKGFNINFDAYSSGINIYCDKEAIKEAIINLLDNAVKYSGNSKEIIVKTGIEKEHGFVQITDFGLGIADENKKHIFDKFYRVPTGAVHNTKGTGLGLAIVKQIVDYHKGTVSVNSTINKGSSFRLSFVIKQKD